MDQNLFLFPPTNIYQDFARNPKNKKIVAQVVKGHSYSLIVPQILYGRESLIDLDA